MDCLATYSFLYLMCCCNTYRHTFLFRPRVARETIFRMQDVKQVVSALETEQQIPQVPVELVDNELSVVFANSNRGRVSHVTRHTLLRSLPSLTLSCACSSCTCH